MSIKSVFLIIALQGIVGMIFYKYFPDYGYIPVGLSIIAGIIGQLLLMSNERKKSSPPYESPLEENNQPAGEYDNDFSKVPAGTADPIQPPPLSIGGGYGDGGRTLDEDLERIGIEFKGNDKYKKY